MKKLLIASCIGLLPSIAKAQFIVIDPGDIAATIANGVFITKTNQVIEDANQIAQSISTTVDNIRKLQRDIDDALYNVKALINGDKHAIANITFEMDATARIQSNLNAYTNGLLPGEHDMFRGYGNADVSMGADILQHVFEYGLDENLPNEYGQIVSGQNEKLVNREIYSYATSRKKIEIALTYNQLAEVMIAKAERLNKLLNRGATSPEVKDRKEDVLKMNEAERIRLFETSASYVRKSLDLKLQCDQLIRQEMERARPVQESVIKLYTRFQKINSVMTAPVAEGEETE